MKPQTIFIGEAVCGALWNELPQLRAEGAAMLRGLAEDGAAIATVVTPLVSPSAVALPPEIQRHTVGHSGDWIDQWVTIAARTDVALVIAPETEGVLAELLRALRASGIRCIAPDARFVDAASDKRATAEALRAAGVPTPATFRGDAFLEDPPSQRAGRWVVKPRDGCGSADLHITPDPRSRLRSLEKPEAWVVQPMVEGTPVSVAVLAGPTERVPLPPMRQTLDEHLRYHGGHGPLRGARADAARRAAVRAVEAFPGAAEGYVGVDLLIPDDGQPVVIEINPRLTTSYIGYRAALRTNLAEAIIGCAEGTPVGLDFSDRDVRFDASGIG